MISMKTIITGTAMGLEILMPLFSLLSLPGKAVQTSIVGITTSLEYWRG